MSRTTRIAGSFTVVVICYWAYALLVVPWIEPAAAPAPTGQLLPSEIRDPIALQLRLLSGLFPPGAWELKNPKILESDRAKLLFREYRNFPDGRVQIDPCTIVFSYDGPAENEDQRRRMSVILEAPGGALLQFDQPLDLNRAKVGRLIAGQLKGDVTIRSDWKQPGPEDDLLIQTQDIQLTEQTASTPHAVDFRWGGSFGRGRQMTIRLLAGQSGPGLNAAGPNVAGIESFELLHVDRLRLDLGREVMPQSVAKVAPTDAPVEINCRGPFHFDVVNRVASFRDRVDVRKPNSVGPADQIACDMLSLWFVDRVKGQTGVATANNTGSLDMTAERIEARGRPVVVTAPSKNLTARAERMEYNLLKNSIALDGGQEVFLQQGQNEIHSRSLYYQSDPQGRLGRVAAEGPGWLRGQSPDRPDQQLHAVWKKQLRVAPDNRNQVISLTGGAELRFPAMGQLQAGEIFFWLREIPTTAGQENNLQPDRMLARNAVRMNSTQIACKVETLEVWFAELTGNNSQNPTVPQGSAGSAASASVGGTAGSPANDNTSVGGLAGAPASPSPAPTQPVPDLQRFEVTGRLLRARVLLGPDQAAVSHLTIIDGVRFQEMQTTGSDERPLIISGDRLEAVNADSPAAAITVNGTPARMEGRGLGLTGSNINLHRGTNRLWIDGPGQMDMPMSAAAAELSTTSATGPMTIDWVRRMEFDGQTAQFDQSVVAATGRQQLQTETMRVKLHRPISFSQTAASEPPQVEEIQCCGGVSLENHDFDPQQQLVSHDQMQMADMAINLPSGALTAGGPGWLNTVRRGTENPLGNQATSGNAPVESPAPQDQLVCLHVRFQKSISGNLTRRQMAFHGQVHATYAPVDNWNAMLATNNPELLGPRGVVLRCDRLAVVEMPLPVGNRRAIELEALGNTMVENAVFTALGNRITYAEAKDLLVLEGDGRNNAQLFRQLERGAERSEAAAQKIYFWPKTNRLKIDGAQSLQIGQPPNGHRMQ